MIAHPRRRLGRCTAFAAAGAMLLGLGFMGGRASSQRTEAPRLAPLLAASTTVTGEAIAYPAATPARVNAAILTLPPGGETGWHTHTAPTFGYMLEGELTVDYGPKGTRTYRAGDALLEAITTPHNGRNSGAGAMRILAVFMGAEGLPPSVPRTQAAD